MAQLDRNPERSPIAWVALEKLAAEVKVEMVDLVFFVLFPKIDYNVVPSPVHLLRCPMSVHTGSYGVVVPIMLTEIDSLNPGAMPNLQSNLTMGNFQKWIDRFELYLWSRHPMASELVCLNCIGRLTGLLALTRDMMFGYDLEKWRAHLREKHPKTIPPSPQTSTLREAIHQRTARIGTGLTDWSRKYSLFTQLSQRL